MQSSFLQDMKNFCKNHLLLLKTGLLTAASIMLFQVISLFVLYRYLQIDYALCLAALFFLGAHFFLGSRFSKTGTPLIIEDEPVELLTAKEMQVLHLLAEGKTNKEIANALFIAVSTVKSHVNRIYSKLAVSNRKEARVKYAEMLYKIPVS